jgi:hypothetical protein
LPPAQKKESWMTEALLLDLLEWVAAKPRQYAETMEAWRTSCPRLPVWEEAVDRGFVRLRPAGRDTLVVVTQSGSEFLGLSGR